MRNASDVPKQFRNVLGCARSDAKPHCLSFMLRELKQASGLVLVEFKSAADAHYRDRFRWRAPPVFSIAER